VVHAGDFSGVRAFPHGGSIASAHLSEAFGVKAAQVGGNVVILEGEIAF